MKRLIPLLILSSASSGTWGFSIGMELNVDMLEQKLNEQKQKSVASNLSASNINIKAGKTTTIQGSNVGAANDLTIEAENLNVVAAKDINTSQSTSEHKNVNISYGMYSGGSASASADKSESDTTMVTHTNSQLGGKNVKLKAKDTTTIEGANIAASDTLKLDTKHLTVASVQDTEKSRSSSVGISVSGGFTSSADNRNNGGTGKGSSSVSGGGFNASNSHSSSKQTVLTTLTGGNVDINVEEDTTLTGATIAAVDENGNDNGQLKFTTGTLHVSALSNTSNSTEMSLNVGAGSTMSLDASVDKKNSKTKTLGTMGSGDIQINDAAHSDTKLLNHDIANNTLDIYDIESHKGLQGSLDTRFLSEKGRNQIAEDIMKTGMLVNTIEMMATTEKVSIKDFFSENDKRNKTYEAVKEQIAKDPKLGEMLQDPNLSAQDKEKMLNQLTNAVMTKLEQATYDTKVVAEKDELKGFYSTQTDKVYINDTNNNSTTDSTTTAGHEMAHVMDAQDGSRNKYTQADRETYANNFGESFANYTNMAMTMNGFSGGMATTNNHVGNDSPFVLANTAQYDRLDKSQGDGRLTERQQAAYEKELADCGGRIMCSAQATAKYGVIDKAQGTAERLGGAFGFAHQIVSDGIDTVKTVYDAATHPVQTMTTVADKTGAVLSRAADFVADPQLTEGEKAALQQAKADAKAKAADMATLDGEGFAASFGEGTKTGAFLGMAVGMGKLNKTVKVGDAVADVVQDANVLAKAGEKVTDTAKVLDDAPKATTAVPDSLAMRERVIANIAESGAARDASNFGYQARYETAYDFYQGSGFSADRTLGHMQGIDFSMPVRVTELTPGTSYVQHVLGDRLGNYFAPVGTSAEMLGINPSGRVPTSYTPSQPIPALQSTAARITDTWTVPSQPFEAGGGGTQYFVPNKGVMQEVRQ